MEFEEICKIYGKTIPRLVPVEYERMMSQIVPQRFMDRIPWKHVMPDDKYRTALTAQQAEQDKILLDIGQDIDYLEIYSKTKSVFNYLQPAKVDMIRHKLYSLSDDSKQYVEMFKPDKLGYLSVPKYSLCDTVTGRMKVAEGPNVLLLPRKMRDLIQSRFGKDGSIWYLDYTSLEPRVVLSVKDYVSNDVLIGDLPLSNLLEIPHEKIAPLPQDIYAYSLKKMKLSAEINRDTLKQIVLPQLYGQAKSVTIDALDAQGVREPDEVVDMVNEFFGIDFMRQYVFQEFSKTGYRHLRTFYHRHVVPSESMAHALLNYYVQASAVDVALLGFEKICRKLAETPAANKVIIPIFVLHDALILDVHNSVEHLIPKLCMLGSKDIPGFAGQRFWMSGSKL